MGGMGMGDHVMQNTGGMQEMIGMDHSNMGSATAPAAQAMDHSTMKGMDHSKMEKSAQPAMKGMDHSGMAMSDGGDPFYAPGSGLTPKAYNGGKFLSYKDLRAARPMPILSCSIMANACVCGSSTKR